jgi:Concanavalin A-like lectin/glucanases superfamily/PKD domain
MFSSRISSGQGARRRGVVLGLTFAALALVAVTLNLNLRVGVAGADTAPVDPSLPVTVSAAALPTVQINGVVWAQVIVGNRVYATGQFTQARPAGAAAGTNQTARSNILAYDLTTGALVTSWAPTLDAQGLAIAASADGSTIYVGGDFDHVSGQSRSHIAALNATTGAVLSFNPRTNSRVAAITVAGSTVYFGGAFTTAGNPTFVARGRLAAANAATSALLPWAPVADAQVVAMVFHPGTGRVIVGGHIGTLNGTPQLGMGSVDGITGATMPWAANQVIKNTGDDTAISALTTDGDHIYGTGWAFFSNGGTGNFEGVFSANPSTGALDWVDGGRGDNYGIAETGDVLYTVGHPHDWGMLDWNPQYDPYQWQRAMAIDKDRSPTLTNAFGTPDIWQPFKGRPAAQPLHWLPTLTAGTYTGQSQGAWSVATNGSYVVLGGEFPKVNGTGQQGLVRFATRAIAGSKVDPVQGYDQLAPTLTHQGAGSVRIAWTAAWDRDNAWLKYEVLRGSTVIKTFTQNSTWWNRPPLGFVDSTAPPGSTQSYRVRVTDPLGNGYAGPTASISIPAGTAPASSYAAAVRADSPSWEWRLGETSGTTAYDRAGSNDLTLNAGVQRNVAGALLNQADPAVNFPGSSSTSTVQGVSPYWQGGPQVFSLEAWFKTNTTSGGKIVGFGASNTGRSSSNGTDRHIYMTTNGQLRFGVRPDMGTRQTIVSPGTYRDNQWHYVVATLSSDGMKLYVDGNLVASNAAITKAQVYRGYWRVGGDQLGSWPSAPTREAITAAIDEVAVYPTALSLNQIRTHYAASGRGSSVPTNTPPTASFTSTQTGLTTAVVSTSTDPDGPIASTTWAFGDDAMGSGVTTSHTYGAPGTYIVTVTVTDGDGGSDSTSHAVTVDDGTTPPPPPSLGLDTFTRTVANGLGTADIGGAWTLSGPTTSFAVTSGVGRITGQAGSDRAGYLAGLRQRDVEIQTSLSLDRPATGGGAYVSVIGRRVSSGNDYRLMLRYQAGGSVTAYLVRMLGGVQTVLANTTVPGITVGAGDGLRVRLQISGTGPTTVKAKVWRTGTAEPTDYLISGTDVTPATLQGAGDVGLLIYTSGSWTGTAPILSLDDLGVGPPSSS